jgi:F0F1-type ATP synthase assembly protein I
MNMRQENKTTFKLFIIMAMSTAILLVSPVIILSGVGYFADNFFHTAPLYMILGGAIGFISGIINVFRMMQLMQKRKKKPVL